VEQRERGMQMSKLIMIVDDSLTVRKIIETSLKREGFESVSFADGIEALRAITEQRKQSQRGGLKQVDASTTGIIPGDRGKVGGSWCHPPLQTALAECEAYITSSSGRSRVRSGSQELSTKMELSR
jgi:CheY-like chemotaxis protein